MVLVYLPIKLGDFVWANVGKSSSTMEHMGQLLVYILSYSPREAGGKTWPQELRNRLLYNNRWVHYIGGYRYIHIELKPDLGLCIWYLVKYGYIIYIHISNISIVIVYLYVVLNRVVRQQTWGFWRPHWVRFCPLPAQISIPIGSMVLVNVTIYSIYGYYGIGQHNVALCILVIADQAACSNWL